MTIQLREIIHGRQKPRQDTGARRGYPQPGPELIYHHHGRTITIRAQATESELQPAVVDEAPGIPEEDATRVFDKFYRVQRSAEVAGTGLGLPISKGIVEAHGGRIWAANQAGGGAAFTIVLPIPEGVS